jgi:trimethylamine-N-oxide reductase (cytochrome c)
MDGKDSFLNDIPDHRVLVDGYYYWDAHPSRRREGTRYPRHPCVV